MDHIHSISDLTLMRVQAGSGAVFGTFLGTHMLNHMVLNLGWGAGKSFLLAARHYYQFPLIERVVLPAAFVVHLGASTIRFLRRRAAARVAAEHAAAKKSDDAGGEAPAAAAAAGSTDLVEQLPWTTAAGVTRWQRITGAFMLVFVGGHVAATRIVPLYYLRDPSVLDHGLVTITLRLMPAAFYPYYTLFGVAGVYHVIHGLGSLLRVFAPDATATSAAVSPVGRSRHWRIASLVGALLVATSIQVAGARFYPITVPYAGEVIDVLYRIFGNLADYRSKVDYAVTGVAA